MPVMQSKRTAKGFVYVVSATNGYVKIGKASNPYERFSNHQASSPLLLTLAYVCECPNPVDIEESIHLALDPYRRHREWFEVPTEVAVAAVREALTAAGVRIGAAPHRSGPTGARALLRATINEMALA